MRERASGVMKHRLYEFCWEFNSVFSGGRI